MTTTDSTHSDGRPATAAGPQAIGARLTPSKNAVVEHLLVALLIVNSASWIADIGQDAVQYTVFCSVALCALAIGRFRIHRHTIIAAGSLSLGVLLVGTVLGLALWDFVFLANLLLAMICTVAFRRSVSRFLLAFNRVMLVLTLASLVMFPFVFLEHDFWLQLPDSVVAPFDRFPGSGIEKDIYTLFGLSYYASSLGPEAIWRNQSLFWEPGMYGVFLVFALTFSRILQQHWLYPTVFAVGILTTLAPGVFALTAFFLGFWVLSFLTRSQALFTAAAAVACLLIAASLPLVREALLMLFNRDIYTDNSITIRMTDLWLPFQVALQQPLTGFADIDAYQSAMKAAIDKRMPGITNSFSAFAYRYGYLVFGLLLVLMWTAVRRITATHGYLFALLIFAACYQPLAFSAFFLTLVLVGINASTSADREARGGAPA